MHIGVISAPKKHSDPVMRKKGLLITSKKKELGLKNTAKTIRKPPKANVDLVHPKKNVFFHCGQAAYSAVTSLLPKKQMNHKRAPLRAIKILNQAFFSLHAEWIRGYSRRFDSSSESLILR